jgi:two-component system response regulator (stage 0 sporulation protein F)
MTNMEPENQTDTAAKRVLIVEDDPNQRLLYQEELAEEGYEIFTASDGREGLAVAREHQPDLVILDINMPVMDGLDTLNQMLETNPGVPTIINTAYPGYQDSFSAWSADAYVVKSSDLAELKATVKRLLEK